jgi:hypothetical protein
MAPPPRQRNTDPVVVSTSTPLASSADLEARLYWDRRGVVLGARPRALLRDRVWDEQGLGTVALRWKDLLAVRAEATWPWLRLEARHERRRVDYRLRFPSVLAGLEAHLEAFLAAASRRAPAPLEGWRAYPDCTWQPVLALPGAAVPRSHGGPFRSVARAAERLDFVWERPLSTGWRRLFGLPDRWPVPTVEARVVAGVRAIRVTATHVYAAVGRKVLRLRRHLLRAHVRTLDRSGSVRSDALLFGRRTELRLDAIARRACAGFIERLVPATGRLLR